MNLSAPWESVVPTLDGPVLVALAKVRHPATGRQVHQLMGRGSEAGVRNVLNRLAHQGIVHASPAGSAVLYSINRDHIAWAAVQVLAGLRGEILARLRTRLGEWDPRPRTAAVFGSAARGDGDAESDIDLLLIRRRGGHIEDDAWQAEISLLREEVMAWTGNTLQVYDIGSDDLARSISARDPLVTEWRADAITVCGTDLRSLLRDLGHRVTG